MYDSSTNERPDLIERYETAGNTSDLTVTSEHGGAGDLMVAAGWSESRVGMALIRLHSEWSGMVKPRRADKALIETMAAAMPDEKGRPDTGKARKAAHDWYVNELHILANGLASRQVLWRAIEPWLARKGIAPDTAAAAILFWLDENCRVCDGLKQRKVEGQPALSARVCHACQGTGRAHKPKGAAPVLVYMDDAVSRARQSLKNRLHNR